MRVEQVAPRHEVGQERLPRRERERAHHAAEKPEAGDPQERGVRVAVVRREVPAGVEDRQRASLQHQHELRDDEQLALVDPVGERAAGQREEEHRDAADEVDEAEVELGAAQRVDDDRERVVLHPRAGVGDERAGPEQAEVAGAERLEGAAAAVPPSAGAPPRSPRASRRSPRRARWALGRRRLVCGRRARRVLSAVEC